MVWDLPRRGTSDRQIAAENVDRLTIAKLDVDANPLTAQQYQVTSIPALIVFNGGKPVPRSSRAAENLSSSAYSGTTPETLAKAFAPN